MLLDVWNVYFGPIGVNLSIILLGLLILAMAIVKRLLKRETKLFEIAFLLFLAGVLYFTLHGRLLQLPFPITVPEKPLVDNNLTFNYFFTSLLTFIVFPALLIILMKNDASLKSFGLKVLDYKQTFLYAFLGAVFSIILFLLSNTLFGFRWIPEHTSTGLVLWVLLVSILSVFAQVFFFEGLIFNRYLDHENGFLLAFTSILSLQMFISSSLFWTISTIISSIAKIIVTWKTRNIYSAAFMSITTGLIDIFIQVL